MTIGVLAWGSLVWEHSALDVVGDFKPTGPRLPIEFSRVSSDGRLTLVIDEGNGVPCMTHSAVSAYDYLELDAAIGNLCVRERMPNPRGIGFVDLLSGKRSSRAVELHPRAVETIGAWADANDYAAVIWTALASNFHKSKKGNTPFSIEAAIRYLERLDPDTHDASLAYIRRAPVEVQTPVRTAVHDRWPVS